MTGGVVYSLVNSIVPIYPLQAAQGKAFPLATYRVQRNPQNDMNGTATAARDRVSISIHSKTYDECESLKNQVIAALDFTKGTIANVQVINIRYISDTDLFQDEPNVYGKTIDFDFWVEI